jgi:endonuclease/exonuclease/phosphatase family metal-dependent hydrolase
MRLATYNVENLFERAAVMNLPDWQDGRDALAAYAKVNGILGRETYTEVDLRAIQAGLEVLGLGAADESPLALLRQNRGRRLRALRRGGEVQYLAGGRGEWIGWLELKAQPVDAEAIDNTGRVIGLLDADVMAVVEAESRPSLLRFNSQVLRRVGARRYASIMLVDGNDLRGIDVGLLTREGFPIRSVVSHVDDRDAEGRLIFSRDCPEYEVGLPGGGALWVLVNHFKSQGYGGKAENDARREAQARRAREIYEARLAAGARHVAVVGDLNSAADQPSLAPLLGDGGPRDIQDHERFTGDPSRPGTWKTATVRNRLDYLLLSPALRDRVTAGGIERRGIWGGRNGTMFDRLPEVTREEEAAPDHAALWAEFDLA